VAGAVGLMSSWLLTKGAAAMAANAFPAEYGTVIFRVTPDMGTFVFVFAVSMIASLLFGLAPALESSRSAFAASSRATRELLQVAAGACAMCSSPARLPSPWR